MSKKIIFILLFFAYWLSGVSFAYSHSSIVFGATVITQVAKRHPVQYEDKVVPLTRVSKPGAKLTVSSKRRPSQATIIQSVSPSRLRRQLSSRSAIIMDADSGQVLYSHNPDRKGQPASTIKVLTGLIAMKSLRDTAKVKVSRRASRMPRSKIYIKSGRQYKANDLINAVLISSANDASVALAEKVAGSERTFAKLMNHKARQLGATSTVCKSASGLTVRGQRSTVRDLANIFTGAMQDEEFARRINKARVKTSYGKVLNNHNKALWRIRGALGGKTGFTHAARQTYVGQFSRGDYTITVAIMGSETMWDDIARLVEFGFTKKVQLALVEQQERMRKIVPKRLI